MPKEEAYLFADETLLEVSAVHVSRRMHLYEE